MRAKQQAESSEERRQRRKREAQIKREQATANEAAIDRTIRLNIREYGP
jgi:hypothetical protein